MVFENERFPAYKTIVGCLRVGHENVENFLVATFY